ncbi:hypothetical protein ES703_62857 [subsurface metagenome]
MGFMVYQRVIPVSAITLTRVSDKIGNSGRD